MKRTRGMTKEQFLNAFRALSQEGKHAVAEEIMRAYCRAPGGCVAEMMSLCSNLKGRMSGFPFARADHTGENT